MSKSIVRPAYEARHKREVEFSPRNLRLEIARVILGERNTSPRHASEKAPRYITPQPRGLRAVAALALASGLTFSFNGAKDVSEPMAPYIDKSVDCKPHGFQKIDTPKNPLNQVENMYSQVKHKGDLVSGHCIDEFYDQVRSQVEPAFAMDVEYGFTTPEELILPRFYTAER